VTDRMADARGRMRASDADRERAVEELKVKFVHGRLSKDELDLRVGLAFVSRTYADLAAILVDSPARPVPAAPRPVSARVRAPAGQALQPAANRKARSWSFGAVAMILPAVIAAALLTSNQGLFGVVVASLMAYFLALLMAAAWLPRAPGTHPAGRPAGGYRRGQRMS
jgi:Domain of unknown function (DUF1707)